MDRKYVENWLDILKESWLNKDSNKAHHYLLIQIFIKEIYIL